MIHIKLVIMRASSKQSVTGNETSTGVVLCRVVLIVVILEISRLRESRLPACGGELLRPFHRVLWTTLSHMN